MVDCMKKLKKILKYWKFYGTKLLWLKIVSRRKFDLGDYKRWTDQNIITDEEINRQRSCLFTFMPLISIAVPVFETPERFLKEMIDSVLKQTYANWELCIADGSRSNYVAKIIQEYSEGDSRIKLKRLKKNYGIVGNSNFALEMCTGEYIGLLDHDDTLTVNALYEIVKAINSQTGVDILYSDEDKMSMDSTEFFEPHFKSNYNLDLLRANNYICHFCVIKTEIIRNIGGFRNEFEGAQDYDLILRSVENSERIIHIPKILYHWRCHQKSTAENPESKLFAYISGKKAIEDHLKRTGIKGDVFFSYYYGFYHVKYRLKKPSKVSIVILNKENSREVDRCKKSIIKTAGYNNFSFFEVKRWNEIELEKIDGEYILFVESSIRLISNGWMKELLAICQRTDVDSVGVKIINKKDQTIYHAGIVCGMLGYSFQGFPRELTEVFHRESLIQDVSAVSVDFMMISKKRVLEIVNQKKLIDMDITEFYKKLMNSQRWNVADLMISVYKTVKKDEYIKYCDGEDQFYNSNFVLSSPGYRLQ